MQVSELIQALLLFAVAIFFASLMVVILSAERRRSLHYAFSLSALGVVLWSSFIALFILTQTPWLAELSVKTYYIAALLIIYGFFLMIEILPISWTAKSLSFFKSALSALPAILVALIVLLPGGLIEVINLSAQGNTVQLNGAGYLAYTLVFSAYAVSAFVNILIKLRRSKRGEEKRQLRLIAGTLAICIVFGMIFNLFLPLTGNYHLIWIGPLSGIPGGWVLFYAIARYELFDIRATVVRSVVYLSVLLTLSVFYYVMAYLVSVLVLGGQMTNTVSASPVNILLALVLAMVFQPIKRFYDRLTNRWFYRDSYDTDEFFFRINQIIRRESSLSRLLRMVSTSIARDLKAAQAFFYVRLPDGTDKLAGTAHHSQLTDEEAALIMRELSLSSQSVTVLAFVPERTELRRVMGRHNLHMIMPLVNRENLIGFFALGEHRSNGYTKRDIANLSAIAGELALAAQNAMSVQAIKDLNSNLQMRINAATRELRRSNTELRRLDAAKDEFVSMASHQLRTPLTSVKGYISMVLEGDGGPLTPMQRQLLEEAFTSSERMVHLINDFLNVSRLQTGRFELERQAVDLAALTAEEVESLARVAETHRQKIVFKRPARFPLLWLDEDKIRQVIMNFIDNAIYYSPEQTVITVRLYQENGDVVLRIEDEGIGVPPDERARLFNKFFRASNARKQRPDGTGVGLYLAKKVVTAHSGRIIFESTAGEGSVFGFRLPIRPNSLPSGQ